MEREEKGKEAAAEKQEFLGIKLRRGFFVGKRGGPCTPVPTWKFEATQDDTIKPPLSLPSSSVSARKLGANLWEIQKLPLSKMNKSTLRVRHHKDKGLELPTHLSDPSHSPPNQQPESASSLRRHVAASLMQHHQSIERNGRALQPVSPASYSSSMEVAHYNPAMTPTSSLDFKGRLGDTGYSLKTSTELLKVLNRIWSLEEQHASNISLMKAMKMELGHARVRIKELLHEQQADRQEIDDLMKQVAEEKLARRSKEQDHIKAAVQSVRDELEDERRLRKRSESLHRKLARELSEVKSAFSKTYKELERERKARTLLEDLCDEFAKGIGDYEQEVRALKHKCDKDRPSRDDHDRLILHVSEAWLDERMQMKLAEARCDTAEKNTIVDKLSFEIETFLQAKRSGSSKNNDTSLEKDPKDSFLRRQSLESIHLNEATSAPQDGGDEEDSTGSDSHCFEINKNVGEKQSYGGVEEIVEKHHEEVKKSKTIKKKVGSHERIKGRIPSNLQVQFEEQMARAISCNGNKTQSQIMDGERGKYSPVEKGEVTQEGSHEGKSRGNRIHGSKNSSHSHLIVLPENEYREESCVHSTSRGHTSPVQKWVSRFASPDIEISESSSKWPRSVKERENTLKAKLLEARLEGQHSRVKASRGSS